MTEATTGDRVPDRAPVDAASGTSPEAASSAPRPWLRGRRDLRLDVMRGFALFAMSINHAGFSQSYVHAITGRSQFLVSAAEGFLVISGFTLGLVARREGQEAATTRIVRRTGQVWLATVGIGFGMILLEHLATGDSVLSEFADRTERWEYLLAVLTLRESPAWVDILVLYVVYLVAALPIVVLLHRGRTWLAIGLIAAAWLVSQIQPEAVELPVAAFRAAAANAPLFLGGLVLGYHHRELSAWWRSRPWAVAVDGAVVAAAVALGVLYALDYPGAGGLGDALGGEDPLLLREIEMPWPALLVVAVMLRAFWVAVTWGWVVVGRTVAAPLSVLGSAALVTFGSHVFAISLLFLTPGVPAEPEALGRAAATGWILWYAVLLVVPVLTIREAKRRLCEAGPAVHRTLGWLPAGLVVGLTLTLVAVAG